MNPFEETFRRAAELVKTGSLPEPDLPTDDTLHTPHVFPLLTEGNNIYASQSCHQDLNIESKSINSVVLTRDLDLGKINNQSIFEDGKQVENTTNLLNESPDSAKIIDSSTKLKLKEVILKNKQLSVDNNNKTILQTILLTPVVQEKTSQNSDNDNITSNCLKLPVLNTNTLVLSESVITKGDANCKANSKSVKAGNNREDMLERNRAAAVRCRQKRKKYLTTLELNHEKVRKQNVELLRENALLRSEILELKTLLLAHKECSVTKTMSVSRKL